MQRKQIDWITGYLQLCDMTEPPELYHEWIAISVLASAMKRKCWLPWGHITWFPNMYIVLVGPSGRCRKGTAMNIGASIMREMGLRIAAESVTRESLIQELLECTDTAVLESGTIKTHASMNIYAQELVVFLGQNNTRLLMDLVDWYDCRDRWKYKTKTQGTDEIVNVWVNLIGATTPHLIQTNLPADTVGGGLASRIIFVYQEDKKQSVPEPFLTPQLIDLREELINDLEQVNILGGAWDMHKDVLNFYRPWYINNDKDPPFADNAMFDGYITRRPGHLLKLSMIMSASRGNDKKIILVDIERAAELLERTEKFMPFTFAGVGRSRDSDLLADLMAFIFTRRKVTKSALLNAFKTDIESNKQLDDLIVRMRIMRFIKVVVNLKGDTFITCLVTEL